MSKHRNVERAEQVMKQYLDDLKNIVNIDSGTFTKAGVDRVGAYLQERFQAFGFSTSFDLQEQYGDHLIATHAGKAAHGPRILLIGHIDTVFPEGEAQRRPFTISERERADQSAVGTINRPLRGCRSRSRSPGYFVNVHYRPFHPAQYALRNSRTRVMYCSKAARRIKWPVFSK